MSQQNQYADPDTASMITNWAQTRYAAPATGFYQPKPSVTTPGGIATAPPTTWSGATGAPGSTTLKPPTLQMTGTRQPPALQAAPNSAAAPTIGAPPAHQITAGGAPAPTATTTIGQDQLAMRNVDAASETVQGRMTGLLDSNSQYMQQARADAMRSANERGMMNSAMAASGGTDAAIRSALPIATTDAGTYAGAADYNVALKNQATMWNADQTNQGNRLNTQMADSAAGRAQAAQLAQMTDDTNRWQQTQQLQNSQWQTQLQNDTSVWTEQQRLANSQWETQLQADTTQTTEANRLANAQWEKQVSDATTRWQAEMQDATSRYNNDANYRNQADDKRLTLANNVIANMELSPDRKAAMLEALGQGTSAGTNPDGSYRPGTGLAGAVYVIDSVGQDLSFNAAPAPAQGGLVDYAGYGSGGSAGAMNRAAGGAFDRYNQAVM